MSIIRVAAHGQPTRPRCTADSPPRGWNSWEPSGSQPAPPAPLRAPETTAPQRPDQLKQQSTRCRSRPTLIRDEEVVGSNPATPTLYYQVRPGAERSASGLTCCA